jgi:hypothetical protein
MFLPYSENRCGNGLLVPDQFGTASALLLLFLLEFLRRLQWLKNNILLLAMKFKTNLKMDL